LLLLIKIVDLYKRFDTHEVTRGVDLEIPRGQMTVIVGQSGEGKSVLLKQIIGLIKPSSGHIFIDEVDITKLPGRQLATCVCKMGYVFQFAALLDSLTVFDNIAITLLENGMDADRALEIVKEKLHLVNLDEKNLYKYPSELSGGMRKRVGLARTLSTNPEVILYDEPTTGLDPITTRIIHELMDDMQNKLKLTSVVVSHDLAICEYADNVALLSGGKIRYFGPAKTIWESEDPYVYQFVRGLTKGPIITETEYI
jgi:phospholipid/cholesterol/gamma-HCH transport system ATP-binding protein